MTEIITPGAGIIYMKVGTHAQEPLDEILRRKQKEIEDEGFALWGYGGGTCHPLRVQAFAREFVQRGHTIYLVMQPMTSRHFAEPARATAYSVDGLSWAPIPDGINVRGSRFALKVTDLREEALSLSLARTRVAVGLQAGRPGDEYVRGRVDKALLEVAEPGEDEEPGDAVAIGLVARVEEPYAVIVR